MWNVQSVTDKKLYNAKAGPLGMKCQMLKKTLVIWFVMLTISSDSQNSCKLMQVYNLFYHFHNGVCYRHDRLCDAQNTFFISTIKCSMLTIGCVIYAIMCAMLTI